ncbi:hypothetical protein, partial [Dysosmobacter sp. HCP28S3_G4]|uniref:hypothetical protein n=1 Tax=Dysosmobacter sp. HCP28S3_G4 TaxID=3438938 RepID=UPI003F8AA1D1
AGEAFSPVCFVMPFFSRANFAGLFSFQLLTFVCRTPVVVLLSGDWVVSKKQPVPLFRGGPENGEKGDGERARRHPLSLSFTDQPTV